MTTLQLAAIAVAVAIAIDVLFLWFLWRRETPTMRRERRLRELAPLSGLITEMRSGTAADHWCSKCQRHHDSFGCPTPTHGLMTARTKQPNKVEIALQAREARNGANSSARTRGPSAKPSV